MERSGNCSGLNVRVLLSNKYIGDVKKRAILIERLIQGKVGMEEEKVQSTKINWIRVIFF